MFTKHSWPGAGVHHDLVVAAEGESAAAALQQVADPPQLVQLGVDLADVLQVQLKYFSVWQKIFQMKTKNILFLLEQNW